MSALSSSAEHSRPSWTSNAHSADLVIEPRGRFAGIDVRELWAYRDLLRTFTTRDIRLRYRQTALGVVWVVLQPLLAAGVFSFVFGKVAGLSSDGVPYILFSYSGLLSWTAFNNILGRGSSSLLGASAMVSKVYFPRLLLPISVLGSAGLDVLVAFGLQVVLLIAYGVNPGWHILALPPVIIGVAMLGAGFGIAASGLVVRYRDVNYVIPLLLQLLLFVSPVAYAVTSVPKSVRWAVDINPLTGLLEATRWSVLGRGDVSPGLLIYSCVAAVVVLLVGGLLFSSLERDFADVI